MSDSTVTLMPIEHDPFAVTLTPVDHDPFAVPVGEPSGQVPRVLGAIGQDAVDWWKAQPSWLEQAAALHKASDPNSLRPTDAEIDFASGMLSPGTIKAAGAAGDIAKGIRAYHGSPHDFDRFDLSKIGTGEGAQAYGHGLYMAENEEVARQYRDALSPTVAGHNTFGGERINPTIIKNLAKSDDPGIAFVAKKFMDAPVVRGNVNLGNRLDNAIWTEQQQLDYFTRRARELRENPPLASTYTPEEFDTRAAASTKYVDMLQRARAQVDYVPSRKAGKMYEVNIAADPSHFLDWDKPLSEQHPKVQPLLADAVHKEAYSRALASTNKQRADELWGMVKDPSKAPAGFAQQLLRKPEVVQQLRDAGIPGIKYLDQGSRGQTLIKPGVVKTDQGFMVSEEGRLKPSSGGPFETEQQARDWINKMRGTSNYVVFSDEIVNILRKYGLAGLIAGGAAHFKARATDDPEADTHKGREAFALHHLSQGLRDHIARNRPQL